MMIMPNEESERGHQFVLYIHSHALLIQRANSYFEAEKNMNRSLMKFGQIQI